MLESGRSQWRKLDNAALAFPAVTGKKDTRVFRFYCQLKESVDGPLLQQALDKTMEKYPLYQMVPAAISIFPTKKVFFLTYPTIKTGSTLKSSMP